MENRVYHIAQNQLLQVKNQIATLQRRIWIAEIDGSNIKDWKDYAHAIEKAMRFPTPCDKVYDVYLDWIRDLDWLNSEEYLLIINNYGKFMMDDNDMKREIAKDFEEIILPWWSGEITQYVVDGKAKPFNVYLVD